MTQLNLGMHAYIFLLLPPQHRNPLVSSELMKKRMKGRKMIRIPNISSRVKGSDIEGDWVTVGVVVDKLPPKESVKGNKYAVWKLSDLSSQSVVVTLFLFGKAYQEHWKMVQGSVVALLNPTICPIERYCHSPYLPLQLHADLSNLPQAPLFPFPSSSPPLLPSSPPPPHPIPPISSHSDRHSRHQLLTTRPLSRPASEADASRGLPGFHCVSCTHKGRTQVH